MSNTSYNPLISQYKVYPGEFTCDLSADGYNISKQPNFQFFQNEASVLGNLSFSEIEKFNQCDL
jgi:hypothetical protein